AGLPKEPVLAKLGLPWERREGEFAKVPKDSGRSSPSSFETHAAIVVRAASIPVAKVDERDSHITKESRKTKGQACPVPDQAVQEMEQEPQEEPQEEPQVDAEPPRPSVSPKASKPKATASVNAIPVDLAKLRDAEQECARLRRDLSCALEELKAAGGAADQLAAFHKEIEDAKMELAL
ncbi:unnamed protein product, partial [Polarella glacialis]